MSGGWAGLRTLWRLVRLVVLVIGVLLAFFAGLELVRAYTTLRDGVHPWAGYGFLLLLGAAVAALVVYVAVTMGRRPPVLRPPRGKVRTASRRWLRRYCRYLAKYLRRLSKNDRLSEEERQRAREAAETIAAAGRPTASAEAMRKAIAKVEEEHIQPLVAVLDGEAEAVVRHAVRDIMIGVTLSPYRAIDLLVVVYRSAAMISAVVRVYNSRPRTREMLMTFRDTMRIVATVNYLNLGQKFMERVLSAVPLVGRFMDELAQGFGAGLLTSVAGHAAIDRCRAYTEWDREAAAAGIGERLGDFLTDVKEMFTEDVLPYVRRRAKARGAKEADEPGFWEKLKGAVAHSADDVAEWVQTGEEKDEKAPGKAATEPAS